MFRDILKDVNGSVSNLGNLDIVVAIQGERGSNSHLAVKKVFPDSAVTLIACREFAEVFERLKDRTAAIAVLPFENSLHGAVFEQYDLLLEHGFHIIAETMMRIQHCVVALPGVKIEEVRKVMSHPVALSQCRKWLRANSHIEAVPAYDTAGSARLLMEEGLLDVAAIAPAFAATEYGAKVLQAGIEDHPKNYTRFFVVAATVPEVLNEKFNKASVAFSIAHRPGTLVEALGVFQRLRLNLTKIESRPVRGRPWEYIFFVEVQFEHLAQWDVAMRQLRETSEMVRELGRYSAAEFR